MKRAAIFLVSLALLISTGFSATDPSTLDAQGRQRSLYVSVVDRSGVPVSDLGPSDFVVKEDKVAREVLHVSKAEEPLQVAVLVDTSQAARDQVTYIRQALPGFVAAVTGPVEAPSEGRSGGRNEVAIIGIGERPTILSAYSSNPAVIRKGIDRIWSLDSSGMYLLDAITETSTGLLKRDSPRPVILVVATEGQDFSYRMHDQALDQLRTAGAALYTISLGQPDTGLGLHSRERAIVLEEGPRESGGYHEQVLAAMGLAARLERLADQLTHEYKVTYARPESLIPPEHTTVSVTKAGLVARGTPVKEEQAGR